DGHVYGYSDKRGWVCQDWKTGQEKWAARNSRPGTGSLIYADGCLYLYGEDDGLVGLIEASPAGWKSKGSFMLPQKTVNKAPSGPHCSLPVIVNGHLLLCRLAS